MGTIDLRGDGVNTEMETGSRSTAAPIVAHRASWSEKFRGTPLTEANQAIQAYAWTVGQLRYAQLPHSPTTQPQPDISLATDSGLVQTTLSEVENHFGSISVFSVNVCLQLGHLAVSSIMKSAMPLFPLPVSLIRGFRNNIARRDQQIRSSRIFGSPAFTSVSPSAAVGHQIKDISATEATGSPPAPQISRTRPLQKRAGTPHPFQLARANEV